MASDPESIGEVARLLREVQRNVDKRFDSVDSHLKNLVSAEVYKVDREHTDRRLQELTRALADEREQRIKNEAAESAARKADIQNEATLRKEAVNENKARTDNLRNGLKWVATAILLPIGLFLMTLVSNAGT